MPGEWGAGSFCDCAAGGEGWGMRLAQGFGRAGLPLRREYVFLTLFISIDLEDTGESA